MNPDGITAIFTTVIAIFTIVYSVFAYKLFRESKLSREFHLEAHMIAYLVNGDSSPDIVSLVIRNIGNGIAKNLQFKIIKDIPLLTGSLHQRLPKLSAYPEEHGFRMK